MTSKELRRKIHNLDVTVWVGKGGASAVVDEFNDQLADRDLVKVKFLRAARGGTTTDDLAEDLAAEVNAEVLDVRGNTAVFRR